MRHFLDNALAPVRRLRTIAQDGVASIVLCLLVVALVFEATPPRFLLDPLLSFAAPASESYNAAAPRVVAGSPELDDAPSVEVAADVVASTLSPTEIVQAEPRRQKKRGQAKTLDGAEADDGGSAGPTASGGGTPSTKPSPVGPCRGSASAKSTKHASSNGLLNGTGHGCV